VLWCEHPGYWHPWPSATYHLRRPKEWLVRINPYARLVLNALKIIVPIAGAVAGVQMTEDQLKQAKHEVELMKTLVDKLPAQLIQERPELPSVQLQDQLAPVQGAALRGFRALLFEQDPMREFGDLRRVQAPSGEFLWVCTAHYSEYDPGLPTIPGIEQVMA
jgi:internalin A